MKRSSEPDFSSPGFGPAVKLRDERWIRAHLRPSHRTPIGRNVSQIRILPLDQLRGSNHSKAGDEAPHDSGIYFLWRGPVLLYIGQAIYLGERLWGHHQAQLGMRSGKRIPFLHQSHMLVREVEIDVVEAAYIRHYLPPFNEKIP